jgi:hypothetical protein
VAMVKVPSVDTFRSRLATHLEDNAEQIVDAISSAMFADLGPYQQLGTPGEVERFRAHIRTILLAFRRMVAGEQPFSPSDLAELHLTGGLRARQGIPLEAVTESLEIATRVMWRFVRAGVQALSAHPHDEPGLGDAAAAVADLALETRDFTHELSAALVTGFRMEREHGGSGRAHATADLVDDIIEARWGNGRRVRQVARSLGYEIVEPVVLALLATPDPAATGELDGIVAEVGAVLPLALASRVRMVPSAHLVIVVPRAEGVDCDWVRTSLAASPLARRAIVLVDEEARGLEAAPKAYRELASDLAAARVMANGAGVLSPRETDLLRLLRSLPLVSRLDFVRRVLGPVLDLPSNKSAEVINTLHAYFRGRGRLDETAADLQLHRNSFRYRLDRAQALLGVSFRDGADRLKVEVALALHELTRHEAGLLDQTVSS